MSKIKFTTELEARGSYDLIVAGGGVAGVAAAITAKNRGLKVLLIEKSNILGGLATLGLVNYFVPVCNGRGKQIIFGLCEEWFNASGKYGYNTVPEIWKNGEPKEATNIRKMAYYSPYIFALQLTEMIKENGIDIFFDCIVANTVMEGNKCVGVITESKSGKEYVEGKMFIDATGDSDLLRRAGVPTVNGKNYFTYIGKEISLDSCKTAVEKQNVYYAYKSATGGAINLYGHNQPDNVPKWSGTTVDEVTDYLITNQLTLLEKYKIGDPNSRDIAMLPLMPNFRTTCRLDGDYTLLETDKYKHFEDSVCAINDFDRRDFLYEIPLRCLTKKEYPNILAAGRCASGDGYGWDLIRVIPSAILTGQATAEAAALAIETGTGVANVDIKILQNRLEKDGKIMIHFPDELIPEDTETVYMANDGHM